MDTSILTDLGLTEMISALRAGDISSRQLTLFCLKRIEQLEPHLHAFLTLIPEKALARAEAADRQIGAWRKNPDQPLPPLAGVPIAVKDVLCKRSTSGLVDQDPGAKRDRDGGDGHSQPHAVYVKMAMRN